MFSYVCVCVCVHACVHACVRVMVKHLKENIIHYTWNYFYMKKIEAFY